MVKHNTKEQIQNQASQWVARLGSDVVTEQEKQEFKAWLSANPQHKHEYEAVSQLWSDLATVRFLPTAKKCLTDDTQEQPQKRSIGFAAWTSGIAIACCSLLFALVFHTIDPTQDMPAIHATEATRYSTVVGQQLEINLPDGSIVELNTASEIEVQFSRLERRITLLTGEAYFNVAKDKARPFVVDIDGNEVIAVGTEFNINHSVPNTVVVVTEGTVKVVNNAAINAHVMPRYISVNQKIVMLKDGVNKVSTVDTLEDIAWREKTLVYRDTPLVDAVAEVARYLPYTIYTNSDSLSLSQLKVSGTFSLNSPEATLEAIVTTFNLSKVETDSGIELSSTEIR